MLWPVTVAGVLLGSAVAGVPGGILGGVLGHALDRHWGLRRWSEVPAQLGRWLGLRPEFEQVLFLCLGRMAKAHGRVTAEHLQLARELMQQYRLDEPQRLAAMADFNRGKLPATSVERQLRRLCRQQPGRNAELLDSCWRMGLVHGQPSAATRQLLERWAAIAGLGKAEQQRMQQRHQRRRSGSAAPVATGGGLQQAAAVLGVEQNAEPAQIKRAYRRLLSRHHPDKLMAAGVSEDELAAAGEQVHRIQQAYEKLKRYRGFR